MAEPAGAAPSPAGWLSAFNAVTLFQQKFMVLIFVGIAAAALFFFYRWYERTVQQVAETKQANDGLVQQLRETRQMLSLIGNTPSYDDDEDEEEEEERAPPPPPRKRKRSEQQDLMGPAGSTTPSPLAMFMMAAPVQEQGSKIEELPDEDENDKGADDMLRNLLSEPPAAPLPTPTPKKTKTKK